MPSVALMDFVRVKARISRGGGGGVGGMLPQKILKPRGSEMLFSALFMRAGVK